MPGRRGSFSASVDAEAGQGARINFRRTHHGKQRRFHVRCLPDDFPPYSFHRVRPGGSDLFMITPQTGGETQYAVAFNGDGVPVWWFGSPTNIVLDAKILPDGTTSWFRPGGYDIRSLSGRLIRTVGSGNALDIHGLQLLDNGNYLIGEQQFRSGVDTTAFGAPRTQRWATSRSGS